MLFEKHRIDERSRDTAGKTAGIWLGVTQILLAGVVFYRLYVLGQPDEQIRDVQIVLAVSIFGHMAMQLYLGGVLPVPTLRGMIVIYLLLMGTVAGVCLAVYGVPDVADWHSTWLPALLGPAILVGLYRLVAWLGKRRVERMIGE